eukprot:s2863_g11.t1
MSWSRKPNSAPIPESLQIESLSKSASELRLLCPACPATPKATDQSVAAYSASHELETKLAQSHRRTPTDRGSAELQRSAVRSAFPGRTFLKWAQCLGGPIRDNVDKSQSQVSTLAQLQRHGTLPMLRNCVRFQITKKLGCCTTVCGISWPGSGAIH